MGVSTSATPRERVIAKSGLVALWPYIKFNKFGNWPVGAHVIRFAIERLHIHSNENKHKNNHGYGVKSAILLYQFQCACCDKYG